jgi:hypothetical protein
MRFKLADSNISMKSILQSIPSSIQNSGSGQVAERPANLDTSIEVVRGWLSIKLKTGKCSRVLIDQIALHNLSLGETYMGMRYYYQPFDIYSAIEALEEGKGIEAKPFRKRSRLHGLLHVHHNCTQFIYCVSRCAPDRERFYKWSTRGRPE